MAFERTKIVESTAEKRNRIRDDLIGTGGRDSGHLTFHQDHHVPISNETKRHLDQSLAKSMLKRFGWRLWMEFFINKDGEPIPVPQQRRTK